MRQHQKTHPIGTFSQCNDCRREPKHFIAHGTTSTEGIAFKAVADRHQLECRCGRRTGWCDSLPKAVTKWGELGVTLPLPLPTSPARVTPMRRSQRSAQA